MTTDPTIQGFDPRGPSNLARLESGTWHDQPQKTQKSLSWVYSLVEFQIWK